MSIKRFGEITTAMIFVLLMLACEAASGESAPRNTSGGGAAPAAATLAPPTPTPVPFSDTTFKVNSGSTYEIPFDIQEGTVIEYSFVADLDFNFRVLDPTGNVVSKADRVISDSGRVRADRFGRYTLVFDNGFSLFAGKTVELSHRVVPVGGR